MKKPASAGAAGGASGAGTSIGTGGVTTVTKGAGSASTFPRGATGGWTVDRKPPVPLTWPPKGGVR
jgi:hypothetical protein